MFVCFIPSSVTSLFRIVSDYELKCFPKMIDASDSISEHCLLNKAVKYLKNCMKS